MLALGAFLVSSIPEADLTDAERVRHKLAEEDMALAEVITIIIFSIKAMSF
jgi:hypothetical protein